MSLNLISEEDLRSALRRYRVDPDMFEAAVREKLTAATLRREREPLAGLSPWMKSVAALLPLQLVTGCKLTGSAAATAPVTGFSKLLGYLAFPAISLFLLLGAMVFSMAKMRGIQKGNATDLTDEQSIHKEVEWWHLHRRSFWLVCGVTLALSLIGATWLLYLFYITSLGLLLLVLGSLSRLGLANRQVIGRSCMMGLMFLGQAAAFGGIGDQEIHFVDQGLAPAAFFGGALFLLLCILERPYLALPRGRLTKMPQSMYREGLVFMVILMVPLLVLFLNPVLWPATPARIKHNVESFTEAPYSSSSWQRWEIVASWAIEANLKPDLSGPRQLLAEEIVRSSTLPYILGSAFRTGLVPREQIDQLKDYRQGLRQLLDDPHHILATQPILSLDQCDWVIRAAALRNDMTPVNRDYLARRLHAALEEMTTDPLVKLKTPLRVTQLLDVIERPLDRDQYRERIHDLLRKFHSKHGGGFQLSGGFKDYQNISVGSFEATSCAVELMEIYGIPDGLDINWIRSFLRPRIVAVGGDKYIAAVTLNRLNSLPGVKRPAWLDFLYYERSLMAAVVLVGMCIYATLSAPKPKVAGVAHGLLQPNGKSSC